MGNNLTMRIKDEMLKMLATYETAESTLGFEVDSKRAAEEISEQAAKRYMDIVKMSKRLPFVNESKIEIARGVGAAAQLDFDPWDVCRTENVRIRFAYSIARIFEDKAGARHKFSVWSGICYGSKTAYGKGTHVVVAAPSAQKAVASINEVLGGRENLSGFRDHWTGGGTVGEALATKIGIWAAKKKQSYPHAESDYELIWEPKS